MSSYAIFFKKDDTEYQLPYQLPVNPEEIKVSSVQSIEKYEILKQGQIALPAHMELTEYSFETELPREAYHYVQTANEFLDADYYLNLFSAWRKSLEPVRFIAVNGIGEDINKLVLIEGLDIVEQAGEEGDKHINIKLIECPPHEKKVIDIIEVFSVSNTAKIKKSKNEDEVSAKSSGFHIVQPGESLWIIANKYYSDGSKCNIIFNANKDRIKIPGLIKTGWKLKIPAKSEFSKYSAALPATTPKASAPKAITSSTSYEQGVAGVAVVLDKLYGKTNYTGGTSSYGRTHSSSGGGF
ncbi:MAG: Peptidoglycan-binding lysin protein [Herbinix sp.]|jgi:nucleoid-associated protein YgaU|nr:Peptidoglycan-binding lysin protein [Herbinix sp.]